MNSYRIVCIQQYRQSAATTTTPSIRNPSKPFHLLQTHRPIQSKRQSLRKVKPLTHSPSKIATTHRPAATMKHPPSTANRLIGQVQRPKRPTFNPRPLHQNSIDSLIRFSIPVHIPSPAILSRFTMFQSLPLHPSIHPTALTTRPIPFHPSLVTNRHHPNTQIPRILRPRTSCIYLSVARIPTKLHHTVSG